MGRDNLNPCNRFLSNSLHEYIVSPLIYSCFGRTSHDDNVFCGSGGTHTSMSPFCFLLFLLNYQINSNKVGRYFHKILSCCILDFSLAFKHVIVLFGKMSD